MRDSIRRYRIIENLVRKHGFYRLSDLLQAVNQPHGNRLAARILGVSESRMSRIRRDLFSYTLHPDVVEFLRNYATCQSAAAEDADALAERSSSPELHYIPGHGKPR